MQCVECKTDCNVCKDRDTCLQYACIAGCAECTAKTFAGCSRCAGNNNKKIIQLFLYL